MRSLAQINILASSDTRVRTTKHARRTATFGRLTRILRAVSNPVDADSDVTLDSFEDFLLDKQAELCAALERIDGSELKFCEDKWERGTKRDGYGITRVLEGGNVFEKAAANVSGGQEYEACALSLVFHPRSPMVPTFRADVRRFRVGGKAWYGGGADLTPYYLFDDDAKEFHGKYKATCDAYDASENRGEVYAACKKWCDEYFYIPARKEHRGVGGLFFDDLENDKSCDALGGARVRDAEGFTRAVADDWLDSYLPIVERRRNLKYGEAQERWHHQRRGRYIEFNLLYDRGVRFGLDGGRIEAIMVSAPPRVRWDYDVQPSAGSEEHRLVETLRSPRAWCV
jgi:coproporphyrinogen III oxidase